MGHQNARSQPFLWGFFGHLMKVTWNVFSMEIYPRNDVQNNQSIHTNPRKHSFHCTFGFVLRLYVSMDDIHVLTKLWLLLLMIRSYFNVKLLTKHRHKIKYKCAKCPKWSISIKWIDTKWVLPPFYLLSLPTSINQNGSHIIYKSFTLTQ